jgi:hypothetical protein
MNVDLSNGQISYDDVISKNLTSASFECLLGKINNNDFKVAYHDKIRGRIGNRAISFLNRITRADFRKDIPLHLLGSYSIDRILSFAGSGQDTAKWLYNFYALHTTHTEESLQKQADYLKILSKNMDCPEDLVAKVQNIMSDLPLYQDKTLSTLFGEPQPKILISSVDRDRSPIGNRAIRQFFKDRDLSLGTPIPIKILGKTKLIDLLGPNRKRIETTKWLCIFYISKLAECYPSNQVSENIVQPLDDEIQKTTASSNDQIGFAYTNGQISFSDACHGEFKHTPLKKLLGSVDPSFTIAVYSENRSAINTNGLRALRDSLVMDCPSDEPIPLNRIGDMSIEDILKLNPRRPTFVKWVYELYADDCQSLN